MAHKWWWLTGSLLLAFLLYARDGQQHPALAAGNSISGTVTESNGQPLAGLRVALYQYVGIQGGWSVVASTTTDEQGRYRFVALASGAYRVGFHDDYRQKYLTKYYPSALTLEQATDLLLTGSVALGNINGQIDPLSLITGRVTAEVGTLTNSTEVWALRPGTNASGEAGWEIAASAYVDFKGTYELRVEPGRYRLQVENEVYRDYGSSLGEFMGEYYDNAATVDQAKELAVGLHQTLPDINFQLARKNRIVGNVTDENKRPVAAVNVTLWRQNGPQNWQPYRTSQSYEDGTYELSAVEPGAYRLGVDACLRQGYFDGQTSFDSAKTLNLTTHQEMTVDLIIRPVVVAGAIEGRVTDQAGNPLAGVQVDASAKTLSFSKSTQTDQNGHYTLTALCPTNYLLQFNWSLTGNNYANVFYPDQTDPQKATDVSVRAGATTTNIDAHLPRYRQITGRVRNANGEGLNGINVSLFTYVDLPGGGYWSGGAWTYTNGEGVYTFASVLPGRYRVGFMPDFLEGQYARKFYPNAPTLATAAALTVTADADRTGVDVQLAQTSQIQGTVTDRRGSPLPAILVQVYEPCIDPGSDTVNDGWCTYRSATTSLTGAYTVTNLGPGPHRLKFEDGRVQPAYVSEYYSRTTTLTQALDLTANPGQPLTGINAQLADNGLFTAHISGRVTQQDLVPPQDLLGAGVTVGAFRPYTVSADLTGWLMVHRTETDPNGNYTLHISEPGVYRIGFIPSINASSALLYYPNASQLSSATDLLVTPGADLTHIDATLPYATPADPSPLVAVSDNFFLFANSPSLYDSVLTFDRFNGQKPITARLVQPPSYGQVTLQPDGQILYHYDGPTLVKDSFIYQISDGEQLSNFATVDLIVAPNPPLVARNLSLMAVMNLPLYDTLRVKGLGDRGGTFSLLTIGQNGTARLTNPTTGAFVYTPKGGFVGQDSFTFKVESAGRTSNIATVALAVIDPAASGNRAQIAPTSPFTLTQLASSSALPNVLIVARQDAITRQMLPPLYSLNGGVNWVPFVSLPYSRTAFMQVGVAPRDNPQQPVRFFVAPAGNTVYRTGDFGTTWATNPFPLLAGCESHFGFGNLLAASAAPQQLYLNYRCQGRTGQWAGALPTYPRAIYTSWDAGLTWQQLPFSADKAPGSVPEPAPLMADLSVGSRLYRLEPTYLGHNWYQSDNGGEQWRAGTNAGLSEAGISVLTSSSDSQKLYGMAYPQAAGLLSAASAADSYAGYRSTNGGRQWRSWASQPCPAYLPVPNPVAELQLLALPGAADTLILRCAHSGLYRSHNGGDSWEPLSTDPGQLITLDYGHPGRLLWAKADGLWASDDAGDQWRQLTANYQTVPVYLPMVAKR